MLVLTGSLPSLWGSTVSIRILAFGNCAGEAKQFPTLGSLANELAAANQGGNMRRKEFIWREDKL